MNSHLEVFLSLRRFPKMWLQQMSKGENLCLGSTSDILLQLVGEIINVCLFLLPSFVAKSPKPKSNFTLRSPS